MVKIWTDLSSVLLQSTRLTDGQTDRILIARPRLHSMGKNNLTHCSSKFPVALQFAPWYIEVTNHGLQCTAPT